MTPPLAIYAAPLLAIAAVYLAAWLIYDWLTHLRSDEGALGRANARRRVVQAAERRRSARRLDLGSVLLPDPTFRPLLIPKSANR